MIVEIRGDHLQPRARYRALGPDDLPDHDVAHAGVSSPVVKPGRVPTRPPSRTGRRSAGPPAPRSHVRPTRPLLAPELIARCRRLLLGDALRSPRRAVGVRAGAVQPLHVEPHPGNVLSTESGLLFVDLETCCRGPVEFDLAHAPEEVGEYCPGADQELLRQCRVLGPAVVTPWRWDKDDRLPDGRRLGKEWLGRIRAARDLGGPGP
ncbi:phosphotransferase family protein [Streptomyces sp. Ag109_O5-10]|uniref:phosphotransferase family protein n=1 Tax=Streptomyces sp. Ag109_O5-10 TaxID=1855349 RepID=UPI000B8478A6|nr:phosphotransferase [Streptomyces sp. Ag109_O5-10]